MKWIKLFEGFEEDGYEKIREDEFYDLLSDRLVDISNYEFEQVAKIFEPIISVDVLEDYYKRFKVVKKMDKNTSLPQISWNLFYPDKRRQDSKKEIYINTIFENTIKIYKTDDDWWMLYMPEIRTWSIGGDHPWCFYKCDQIHGLKRFYDNMIFYLLNNEYRLNGVRGMLNREKFPQFPWR
jgi:hypothetical protein